MRICYIADLSSPIARGWIGHSIEAGYEVHVLSTRPAPRLEGLASASLLHRVRGSIESFPKTGKQADIRGTPRNPIGYGLSWRMALAISDLIAPALVRRASASTRAYLREVAPDIVHALRIPIEGMLAAIAEPDVPLVVSVWGNDFTLHANGCAMLRPLTRLAMRRAAALHCDCDRDAALSRAWDFAPHKPVLVAPGNGGLSLELFCPGPSRFGRLHRGRPVVINPRGFRRYVRADVFFRSIPLVLAELPEALFVATAMAGDRTAKGWIRRLGIPDRSVVLLPRLPVHEIADVFRSADVSVSPSEHDGTPNTLLEAMACGCFPIAGRIESIQEWISDGRNGLLCDPTDPTALAKAIVLALKNSELRKQASVRNLALIREKADRLVVGARIRQFYQDLTA